MTDTAAIHRNMKEFLRFATREHGSSILFGVVFDPEGQRWVAAMSAGKTRCTFPAGAGRAFIREIAEDFSVTTRQLTEHMKAEIGGEDLQLILESIGEACKVAMQRNANKSKPQFFAPGKLDS